MEILSAITCIIYSHKRYQVWHFHYYRWISRIDCYKKWYIKLNFQNLTIWKLVTDTSPNYNLLSLKRDSCWELSTEYQIYTDYKSVIFQQNIALFQYHTYFLCTRFFMSTICYRHYPKGVLSKYFEPAIQLPIPLFH